ncbi:MAG: CHAD domain-containing protein [Chloroflexota bacterium]
MQDQPELPVESVPGQAQHETPQPEALEAPGESGEQPELELALFDEPEPAPDTHLVDLALILFDRTQPLHALDEESRHVLGEAARLQGMPVSLRRKKPLQAARKLAERYALMNDLSPEGLEVLAAVVAYHHDRLRRKDFDRLHLPPIRQREALTIAALLRIAVGLNSSDGHDTLIQRVELSHGKMWLVVDGPQAASDALQAKQGARLWEKIGYPEVEVVSLEEAEIQLMPFPKPYAEIGIEPEDSLAEAGRKVMRYHFAQMLRHEAGTRLGEDIEALHDMRVATRRMRAAFEVFGEAFESKILKPHLLGLRAIGRALGTVRDLDVFMEKAQLYLETLPEEQRHGLDPLLAVWQEQRQAGRAVMLAHMDSPEYQAFKHQFNIFLHSPGAGARFIPQGAPVPTQVRELAPMLIYERLAVVRAFDPLLANASIEQLHALRIEFKKLRYTVEYFSEVLGAKARLVIEDLKVLQDHLGDLNDAQVAADLLREFLDEWEPRQADLPIHERQNLEGVVNYLASRHAERHRLMVTFQSAWKRFMRPAFRRNLASAVSVL